MDLIGYVGSFNSSYITRTLRIKHTNKDKCAVNEYLKMKGICLRSPFLFQFSSNAIYYISLMFSSHQSYVCFAPLSQDDPTFCYSQFHTFCLFVIYSAGTSYIFSISVFLPSYFPLLSVPSFISFHSNRFSSWITFFLVILLYDFSSLHILLVWRLVFCHRAPSVGIFFFFTALYNF